MLITQIHCTKFKERAIDILWKVLFTKTKKLSAGMWAHQPFLPYLNKGARLLNWHINMSDGSVRDVIHWPEENNSDKLSNRPTEASPFYFPLQGNAMMPEKRIIGGLGQNSLPMPLHGFRSQLRFSGSFDGSTRIRSGAEAVLKQ